MVKKTSLSRTRNTEAIKEKNYNYFQVYFLWQIPESQKKYKADGKILETHLTGKGLAAIIHLKLLKTIRKTTQRSNELTDTSRCPEGKYKCPTTERV